MGTKRVLVVYYSLTGNTARVGRDLAARLDAEVESIRDRGHGTGFLGQFAATLDAWRERAATIEPLQHYPAEYEVTLIGTPIWAGRMTPAVRAYLQRTRGQLRDVAFFTTSHSTDVGRIVASLEALAGRRAIASIGFNARELSDATWYQRKLAALSDAIPRARAAA
jgi:menaquinone-dependent protoporphyrinogen IX oxidase